MHRYGMSSVDYAPGSIVMYNNGYYQTASGGISNDSGTAGTDIPDAGITDWQPITVDSDMREVWNNTTDYDLGDIVLNNNKYYLAKTDPGRGQPSPNLIIMEATGCRFPVRFMPPASLITL